MARTALTMADRKRAHDDESSYEEEVSTEADSATDDDVEYTDDKPAKRHAAGSRAPKPGSKADWAAWTEAEDECLRSIVKDAPMNADGKTDWGAVSKQKNAMMGPHRSPKQCRDRFKQHADPELKKGDWSFDEYKLLVALLILANGFPRWAQMAKEMNTGRSDNDLKNKFNSMKRKKSFTAAERAGPQAPLIEYVEQLNAAEAAAPKAAAPQRATRRRRFAAPEDSSSISAGEVSELPPPRVERPRRQARAPRVYGAEEEQEQQQAGFSFDQAMPPATRLDDFDFPDMLSADNVPFFEALLGGDFALDFALFQ